MDRDLNRSQLTRRHAVTLLGAGAIVPPGGFKAPSSFAFSATNKAREDLYYTSLTEVGRRIRSRDLSPVDLTLLMLDRIAKFDPQLKSYATVMSGQVLADARGALQEIGAGRYRGPLHGVLVAIKDLCYTKGVRTMGRHCRSQEFCTDLRWHSCHQITGCGCRCAREIEPFRRSRRRVQPVFRCSS
jgi:Amidase